MALSILVPLVVADPWWLPFGPQPFARLLPDTSTGGPREA